MFDSFTSLQFYSAPAGLNNTFSIILLHFMGFCFIFHYITNFMWFQVFGYWHSLLFYPLYLEMQ